MLDARIGRTACSRSGTRVAATVDLPTADRAEATPGATTRRPGEPASTRFGEAGPRVMLSAIFLATAILSLYSSITAKAVLMAPINRARGPKHASCRPAARRRRTRHTRPASAQEPRAGLVFQVWWPSTIMGCGPTRSRRAAVFASGWFLQPDHHRRTRDRHRGGASPRERLNPRSAGRRRYCRAIPSLGTRPQPTPKGLQQSVN
jgi:hypothetical protein